MRRHLLAREPGASAIEVGLDVEFPTSYAYDSGARRAGGAGNVNIGDVDTSLRRVPAKFELGLFENPHPQEHIDISAVAAEGREPSLELARRSVRPSRTTGSCRPPVVT